MATGLPEHHRVEQRPVGLLQPLGHHGPECLGEVRVGPAHSLQLAGPRVNKVISPHARTAARPDAEAAVHHGLHHGLVSQGHVIDHQPLDAGGRGSEIQDIKEDKQGEIRC